MKVLLIDGDVLLYKAAIAAETEIDWGDGVISIHSDLAQTQNIIRGIINDLLECHDSDEFKIAMSSSSNFRKRIDPTYKAGRADSRKPVGFATTREWMIMEYGCREIEGLEADDILGVWATQKSLRGKSIICTIDKDLKQIPGTYHNIDSGETVEITAEEGHWYHMYQTLVGDRVDGFPGCPGVGDKTARKILEEAEGDLWPAVVKAYEKAHLTEADALVQARLARILQVSDINKQTKEPILWHPSASTAAATPQCRAPASPTKKKRITKSRGASASTQPRRNSTARAQTRK